MKFHEVVLVLISGDTVKYYTSLEKGDYKSSGMLLVWATHQLGVEMGDVVSATVDGKPILLAC